MGFRPEVGEKIILNKDVYSFAKHPAVIGIDMPYGQEGRQGTVYQLKHETSAERIALKVFKERYRAEKHQLAFLKPLSSLMGLKVCSRYIVTKEANASVIEKSADLVNSIVMPWIEGPTWADILQEQRRLSKEQCFFIAEAFLTTLKMMEEHEVAHNDLSSSNVLIPFLSENPIEGQHYIELVDVEQMYGPKSKRPSLLPAGSAGYAPTYLENGVWQKEADRFAGAILLGEILSWCSEEVRNKKWTDASYFKADEMQKECERYTLLKQVLHNQWNGKIAQLFEQAWNSKTFAECPSFAQWHDAFDCVRERITIDTERQVEQEHSLFVSKCLEIARLLEERGFKQAALYEYKTIFNSLNPSTTLKQELIYIIQTIENQEPEINHKKVLQGYLELATEWERENNTESACFVYSRIVQFPNIDQALKKEIASIIDEIKEEPKVPLTEAAATLSVSSSILQNRKQTKKQVEYDIDDEILNAKASNQPLTLTHEQREPSALSKWWRKNKKRIFIVGSITIVVIGGSMSYYFYTTNVKYQEYMEQGRQAYHDKKYKLAEEAISHAITVKGKDEAHLQLATIYVAEGKNKIAIDYLTKLIKDRKIDKEHNEATYLLASANFRIGQYQEAVSNFELALANNAKGIEIYKKDAMRDLAVSYMKMKEFEKAEDVILKMNMKTNEDKALISYLKGQLAAATVQLDKAEKFLKEAIMKDTRNVTYAIELSNLYVLWNKTNLIDSVKKDNNYQQASHVLQAAIQKDNKNIELLNQLGIVYYEAGQFYETRDGGKSNAAYQQALGAYNKVVSSGTRDTNTLVNIGILYDKVGQGNEAEKFFAEAYSQNDEDPHVNFAYGMFKIKQKKYEEASRFLRKTVQANENESEVRTAQEKLTEMKTNGWIQ
ncbi:tetratricopeptide repeat protein [Bacillus cytotoxicus]|uniref:tetratricopeptide repeat protein n=1 Tax=Bacillus cereus group sp. BfR-BA-01492 TaxID=2920361 RepID=UPI001F59483D|nr:tetratricopeptide repeat protein [Bacillus cereus group sp. BfR-BA-01492]EMA6343047.1 tetratricopeptide repeat protein [Bacillus cytotoxicus]EMA6345345.1 tetratricopeptide repeat protein [Bacillus cytotoxicus]